MKVLSYSLWGANRVYTAGAVRNAEQAPRFFPGWRARFYCGASVPAETLAALAAFAHVDVVRREESGDCRGMFWRFLPASEPDVEAMLSRDTDSRLSHREAAAVAEWLASDRDFHCMRDHPGHTAEIMGGMWGVRNGRLRQMRALIAAHTLEDRYEADQDFLATRIAPLVRAHTLLHDEYFGGRRFPAPRVGRDFVGQGFDQFDAPMNFRPTGTEWRLGRARSWLGYQARALARVAGAGPRVDRVPARQVRASERRNDG